MKNPARCPFREGEAWAFGLPKGGYAIVIVARAPRKRPYVLLYGFAPRYSVCPSLEDAHGLTYDQAVYVARVYTQGCAEDLQSLPPVHKLGRLSAWNRAAWPVLPSLFFVGSEPHPYRLEYDDDLNEVAETPYPVDQLLGKQYLENESALKSFVHFLDEYVDHPPDWDAWVAKFERLRQETERLTARILERLSAEPYREPTRSTIAALTAEYHGLPPDEVKWFDHFVYFPQKRKALLFARRCERTGYRIERVAPNEEEWSVWLRSEHTLNEVDEVAEQLEALAREYGGEYDGWGVALKEPGSE